ncbi:hypothetical protein QA600_02975 [Natronococcus sp. A-GB1]|uniref:hypothetical protein n=1 Tax=Natronococcus sp. A-GB1 TaxID=3037648 RepID=UPI00241CC028|nr:hypothetical protein [Natronococcus sp. A-GB1]MDG5758298.1 hypothetical protein [Natronococcus sp. A-GB1]
MRGPHETTKEQWYIEFVDETTTTEERLEQLLEKQADRSNVINTRSGDLDVLLQYLVETGQYESTADATRELLFKQLADEYPSLLETYVDLKNRHESDPLRNVLEDE